MTPTAPAFQDAQVEAAFVAFPETVRDDLLDLRELIFDVARRTAGVGPIDERLKWSQPAYLTSRTKSGSTIRLGRPKHGGFAIFTHCQTTILSDVRALFPDDLKYDGNRAVLFDAGESVPREKVRLLIHRALTYHIARKT